MYFKPIVAFFEVSPEWVPGVIGFLGESFIGHAEGEDVDAEEGLAVFEGFSAEGVDFLNPVIGHGKASG